MSQDHSGLFTQTAAVAGGEYPVSTLLGGATATLVAFDMDIYPVTVGRFREFVDEGGYEDSDLWDDDGWWWRLHNHVDAPRWWNPNDGEWGKYLEANKPIVGISWYEAGAFARWAGRQLPTEPQWEAAARGPGALAFPWGNEWEDGRVGPRNVPEEDRVTWPVDAFESGKGPFGHRDLVGNIWQWMRDPLPGEQSGSVPVRGGSWASRPTHCRTDHRNAYLKEDRWSHVGFRTVS